MTPMSEKILFELRATPDGGFTVYESPEWQAYHRPRQHQREWRGPHADTQALRQALAALQGIYDDVYGKSPA
jgi:hypothetical protein